MADQKKIRKYVSTLLVGSMLFTTVPMSALAAETMPVAQGEMAVTTESGNKAGVEISKPADFTIKDGILSAYSGTAEQVEIPSGVTKIEKDVFKDNKTMKTVVFPDSLTEIGEGAFQNAGSLETVTFAKNSALKTIGANAFKGGAVLKSMRVPEGVTSIGKGAFTNEGRFFTSIELPASVTTLGTNIMDVFTTFNYNNPGYLQEINVAKGNQLVQSYEGVLYQGTKLLLCPSKKVGIVNIKSGTTTVASKSFFETVLSSVIIPESVTTIEGSAFMHSKIEVIDIPGNVKNIGTMAFWNSQLKSLILREGIETIEDSAFETCYSLNDGVVIPASVKKLGSSVFGDRGSKLKWVYVKNATGELGSGIVENYGKANFTLYGDFTPEVAAKYNKVTVKPALAFKRSQSVTLNATEKAMELDREETFTASINGTDATAKSVVWISDNPAVVEIKTAKDDTCTVISHDNGKVTLRAIASDGNQGSCSITVGNGEEAGDFKVNESGLIVGFRGEPTNMVIPSESGGKAITGIAKGAFKNNETLNSVTIPATVKTIGSESFAGCKLLETVTMAEGVEEIGAQAFKDCEALEEVTIPESVQKMSAGIFYNCGHLTKANIPKNMTYIAPNTFTYCSRLEQITIPDKVETIGESAFYGCKDVTSITLPASLKEIGEKSFANCEGLTELTVPEGVTTIRKFAFFDCTGMTTLNLPASATNIGTTVNSELNNVTEQATPKEENPIRLLFEEKETKSSCNSMTALNFAEDNPLYKSIDGLVYSKDGKTMVFAPRGSVDIKVAEGTEKIGPYACFICFKLEKVQLPSTLKVVGNTAFHYCEGITEMNLPEGLERIEHSAFFGVENWAFDKIPASVTYIGPYAFVECASETIDIPENITELPTYCFWGYEETLRHIYFPDQLKVIGDSAFSWAKNVKNLILPQSIKSIGNEALGTNYTETFITVPYGCETIGNAFKGCKNLEGVYIPSTVTALGDNPFSGCDKLQYILSDSKDSEAYRFAQEKKIPFALYTEKNFLRQGEVIFENLDRSIPAGENPELIVNVTEPQNITKEVAKTIHNPKVVRSFKLDTSVKVDGQPVSAINNYKKPAKVMIRIPEEYRANADELVLINLRDGRSWNMNVELEEKYVVADITRDGVYALVLPNKGNNEESTGGGGVIAPALPSTPEIGTSITTKPVSDAARKDAQSVVDQDASLELIGDGKTTVQVEVMKNNKPVVNLKQPMEVEIPLSAEALKQVEDTSKLTLAQVVKAKDGSVKLEYVGGQYDAKTGIFTAKVDNAGEYVLVEKDNLTKIVLTIGDKKTLLNDQVKNIDVAPTILQDRTMVPLRYVGEALGCDVKWNAANRSITITKDGQQLHMTIDQEIPGYGQAPVIQNNRTLVPIRYISEALGANVIYDPASRQVIIVK